MEEALPDLQLHWHSQAQAAHAVTQQLLLCFIPPAFQVSMEMSGNPNTREK